MKEKKYLILSIILMIISGIMLLSALMYYDFIDKVKDYKYSDKEEYEDVRDGLQFIKSLPIHFNIINKYFSNMNHLPQKEKEEIVMAYAIKNKYQIYQCGPSNDIKAYLCINKENLNSEELLEKFQIDLTFSSENIKIYVDDYGTYSVNTSERLPYYQFVLNNTDNKRYRMYTVFSHYKKVKDIYTYYVYQGYFNGNCDVNSQLSLYDFMSGDPVYTNTCNANQTFMVEPGEDIKKLQLYKYELKKGVDNQFYLYGYNPVNSND